MRCKSWIQPRECGLAQSHTERHHPRVDATAAKVLVISPDRCEGSATIHQDADIYRIRLARGKNVTHELRAGHGAWLQRTAGELVLNGAHLSAGDAASAEAAGTLDFTTARPTDTLLLALR
jgi:redox-sensitive bicupin YhaK (pirin superfamily)